MHADVADLDRLQLDLRAGRLELHAHVAFLSLHERGDVGAGVRDGVGLVPIDVGGQDGVVEVGPEVVRAAAPREAARRGESVRMRRVGEAQDGMSDRAPIPVDALRREGLHLEDGVAAHGPRPVVERDDRLLAAGLPLQTRGGGPALRVQHLLQVGFPVVMAVHGL